MKVVRTGARSGRATGGDGSSCSAGGNGFTCSAAAERAPPARRFGRTIASGSVRTSRLAAFGADVSPVRTTEGGAASGALGASAIGGAEATVDGSGVARSLRHRSLLLDPATTIAATAVNTATLATVRRRRVRQRGCAMAGSALP
jgi:hypothetical protein